MITSVETLFDRAQRFGTDKGLHGYTTPYALHFAPRRDQAQTILEIGVGGYADPAAGGESLRLWAEYFPHAQIVGIDCNPKRIPGDRITTVVADQADPEGLVAAVKAFAPFDVVIDDGSHKPRDQIATCEALLPHVTPGGLYCIEDLCSSFNIRYTPPEQRTCVQWLKARMAPLHYGSARRPKAPIDHLIGALCCYPKLAILTRC